VEKKLCPFIKDLCRDDCVFKTHNVACGHDIYNCLIAVKLSDINEAQHDDLAAIWNEVKKGQ
jgi:hypothetical protein